MKSRRYKSISKKSRSLLAEGEGDTVDFKRSPDGLSADDLVSFANSAIGGSILTGVDEQSGVGGAQVGVIVGCDVSDATILQIANKAMSCIPPIAIEIHIENLTDKPFLRVDITSSETKPHCTPKGVYCRRDGSRNRALHPSELLSIFLESEARAFAGKFEAAAHRINQELGQLEKSLHKSIQSMSDQLGWADYKLDDTETTLDEILDYTRRSQNQLGDMATRFRVMFRQDGREDPIREKVRQELLNQVIEELKNREDLVRRIETGEDMQLSLSGKVAVELDENDIREVLKTAVEKIKNDK